MLVSAIKRGDKDAGGYVIQDIYSYDPPNFAIYTTERGVGVHFADDPATALKQRQLLAPLQPLRGQISGLIDGWREGEPGSSFARFLGGIFGGSEPAKSNWYSGQARRYDKRVVDALLLALLGQCVSGAAVLAEIKDDIIAQRKSLAKNGYFLTAGLAGVLVLLGALLFAWIWGQERPLQYALPLWRGAAAGAMGAYFSIATGFSRRTILVDLQQMDNRRDALVRMTIGTLGGAVAVAMVMVGIANVLNLKVDLLQGETRLGILGSLIIGFVAGFSERALPDLLSKANMVGEEGGKGGGAPDQAKAVGAAAPSPAPVEPPAAPAPPAPPPDAEDDVDGCLSDEPLREDEVVDDSELPIATGGVQHLPEPAMPVPPPAGDGDAETDS